MSETVWPGKPKRLIIWSFTESLSTLTVKYNSLHEKLLHSGIGTDRAFEVPL